MSSVKASFVEPQYGLTDVTLRSPRSLPTSTPGIQYRNNDCALALDTLRHGQCRAVCCAVLCRALYYTLPRAARFPANEVELYLVTSLHPRLTIT